VDAGYCGQWDPLHLEDPNLAKSQTGYMIMYHGCSIVWALQLQSVFALSTTKAEYVALSAALHDVILVMELLKEMKNQGFDVVDTLLIKCNI
jgi:hypothetical protein